MEKFQFKLNTKRSNIISKHRGKSEKEIKYELNRDARDKNREKRILVLKYYSSEVPFCICCGEKEINFLSIDHIDGGGTKHRKEEGIGNIATYLIKNNFPEGYQVLCHNCNMAKGFYGHCPHKEK